MHVNVFFIGQQIYYLVSVAKFLNDNLYKINSFYKNSLTSVLTQFTPPLPTLTKNKAVILIIQDIWWLLEMKWKWFLLMLDNENIKSSLLQWG